MTVHTHGDFYSDAPLGLRHSDSFRHQTASTMAWTDRLVTAHTHGDFIVLLHREFVCLLFYTIVTVFKLYLCDDMMDEMRRRKPVSTLLPTQGILNLPHHIGLICEELASDDAVSYTQRGDGFPNT